MKTSLNISLSKELRLIKGFVAGVEKLINPILEQIHCEYSEGAQVHGRTA